MSPLLGVQDGGGEREGEASPRRPLCTDAIVQTGGKDDKRKEM